MLSSSWRRSAKLRALPVMCAEGAMNWQGVSATLPHLESRLVRPALRSFFSR
jgi:hypothetical protein